MVRIVACIATYAYGGTPASAQLPTPVPSPAMPLPSPMVHSGTPPPARDRVNDLIGIWSCAPKSGVIERRTYRRAAGGTIVLEYVAAASKHVRGTIGETYTFDTTHQHWVVHSSIARFTGYADPWSGTTWVIASTTATAKLTYALTGAGRFSRTFEALRGSRWETTSVEACTRAS